MSEITIEGTGLWNKQKLRQRSDIREAQIGFNVVHDVDRHSANAYRPSRNLPILFTRGSHVDNDGWVWTQGRILGKYDRRIHTGSAFQYQDDGKKLGINDIDTGEFYAFIDVDGTAQKVKFDDEVWGNSEDIPGLLVPMNGYKTAAVQDLYTSKDVPFGLVDPVSGSAIDDTFIAGTPNASLRDKGDPTDSTLEIFGIATRDKMRETRNQHMHFQREIEAIGVAKRGYMTLPFVVADPADSDTEIKNLLDPGAPDPSTSKSRAASIDQTVLFVEKPGLLRTGNVINVDAWGNPFLSDDAGIGASYDLIEMGTLTDVTYAREVPYGKYVQTHPLIEIAGTGTDGIMHQLFYLARKIKGSTLKVNEIADHVNDGDRYGFATIYFDIP